MPRSCSRRARALLLAGAVLLCSCGGGLEISLQLRPGQLANGDAVDTDALATLRVTLENSKGKDRSPAFALDRGKQVALPALEVVDTTEEFTVDVWGCERLDACDIDDVTLRGCTPEPLQYAGRTGTEVVVVALLPVNDARNEECPSP
ncbi:MAG: hypothetical protein HYS27_25740 [Deltaproteobacteria bacterium]|nr:hypothetical protein [Deltaproteobacteria bacterium]